MWLQSGDRNTDYFHAITKGRRVVNRLTVIEDGDGKSVYEENQIDKVFAKKFLKIFTTNGSSNFQTVLEALQTRITSQMNDKLCAEPSDDEIRKALFAIHADKAHGPNGFSAGFYHSFWDVIGEDVCRKVRNFFYLGIMDPKINETHVCLLPKGIAPKTASEYHPIALCMFSTRSSQKFSPAGSNSYCIL